ncbi:hypothetical protein KU6B_48820 [Mameliella alba]|jgi:hypothetical protein|uniref:Uncharacterized protein n=1 Tax=Mameliella alba TaxID=561184 RepID=A0A0B3S384_9RHOB|nr:MULTISPECIES: hypothetical protein [Mameliella]MCR9276191.1 hypothetical protein [Paracoccaceae bacterium]ODM50045.1 hypothetical protein A9320_11910 [Ruegeria sp. PBVC088]KHQ51146.1 hypothetical protein OA50_04177 [Mameliella alba]MDD9731822.1 hypothetical protein [Mameliella sp. AT18]OWV57334.1 hypothetical protein CDZ98_15095 [Mameliella alba]
MNTFKKALTLVMTIASLESGIVTVADASPLNVQAKRPDLQEYCQKYHRADARLTSYSALAWKCYKSPTQTWGISVNRACQDQHGLPKSRYTSAGDPYSWYCYKPRPKAPGVDLTRYCKKHFGQSARAKLVGKTALDWVCASGQHNRWGISVSTACREQHGLPKASYGNRNDPYSWTCHR